MKATAADHGAVSSVGLAYGVDERPSFLYLILFGIQWFAVGIPSIIVIGKIVTAMNHADALQSVLYLQKLAFITGAVLFLQIFFGHRLPLFAGPSTVLVIAVITGREFGENSLYSTMALGGALMAAISMAGLFGKLQRLFKPRVTAVVLLLIAFTLLPSVLRIVGGGVPGKTAAQHFVFCFAFVFVLAILQGRLRGVWQVTILLWGLLLGSVLYMLFFPGEFNVGRTASRELFALPFYHLTTAPSFDVALILPFIFSFLALSVNDLSSINSLAELLGTKDTDKRSTRGLTLTGMGNILAGFFGAVGPVNFSMSPGVILSTRCASRFVLVPTAVLFLFFSLSPALIGFFAQIPEVIIGGILMYILCAQVSAGFIVAFRGADGFSFEDGLVIALPLIFASVIAFLPQATTDAFPPLLKPIVGNGFVVGVISVMVLEHLVFKKRKGH